MRLSGKAEGVYLQRDCAREVLGETVTPEYGRAGETYGTGIFAVGVGGVEVSDCGSCCCGVGDEEGGEESVDEMHLD